VSNDHGELHRFDAMRASAEQLRQATGQGSRREPPKETGKRLATIPRGDDAELRVVWDSYEGKPYVGIRLWEGRNGNMYPTKIGCTVRLRELADFADGIALAIDEAKAYAANRQNNGANSP
jgi:hypothetical protein